MINCKMPQGHPTHCGCEAESPDRYTDRGYCQALEQERDFLRQDRDSWSAKWEMAIRRGAAIESHRDQLLELLEEMVAMMDSGDEHGAGSAWHQKASAAIAAVRAGAA